MIHQPKSLLFLLFLALFTYANAQQDFHVRIQFPSKLDIDKLSLSYDDGKSETVINNKEIKDHQVLISAPYYAKYAAIIFKYPMPDSADHNFYNCFFVNQDSATISFDTTSVSQSPFDKNKTVNAYSVLVENNALNKYDFAERKDADDFYEANREGLDNRDSLLLADYRSKLKKIGEKDMEFISQHKDSYYFFFYFKKYIATNKSFNTDSLLNYMSRTFSDSILFSDEGNFTKRMLNARKEDLTSHRIAPTFISKDTNGRTINLSAYKNKKYVLLTFWATWCSPCMEEIPDIKTIRDTFLKDKLEIISVAFPSDKTIYSKVIREKKMDWVNIYNDADIINMYGGYNRGIPEVYLVDKEGKIIYKSGGKKDENLSNLKTLLKKRLP